jgi:hypothetical protein
MAAMHGKKKPMFGEDDGMKKEVPDMGEPAKKKIKSFDEASDKGMALMIGIGAKPKKKMVNKDEGY